MAEKPVPQGEKDKQFKCGPIGPGPTYKLPPVVGYPGHDITKWRYPAYSIAHKLANGKKSFHTGPMYDLGKVNRFGKFYSPSFSLLKKLPAKSTGVGPGPAAYNTQNLKDFSKPTPPSASIKSRPPIIEKHIGPGPGAYNPKPPPSKAIKMKFRHPESKAAVGPGPGAYGAPNMEKFRKRAQHAKILSRPPPPKADAGPGPAYFPKYVGPKVPAYSFGVKHSDCVGTYTAAENEEEVVC